MMVGMTPRLKICVEAGDVLRLFPLLKDWTEDELRALLKDIEAFHDEGTKQIEKAHETEIFKAENFLSKARSRVLDRSVDQAHLDLLAICAEIASVAMFYLGDEDVDVST